jgi:hypothetical protein
MHMGRLGDFASHRAIPHDQRGYDRLAERPVVEQCVDEDCARHLGYCRIIDREGAERIGDAFEGAQFAKERTRLDVARSKVLARPMQRHPQAASQDKIDLAVVLRLTGDPGARRRLEPSTLTIEFPTGFWIKRFETGMC